MNLDRYEYEISHDNYVYIFFSFCKARIKKVARFELLEFS